MFDKLKFIDAIAVFQPFFNRFSFGNTLCYNCFILAFLKCNANNNYHLEYEVL